VKHGASLVQANTVQNVCSNVSRALFLDVDGVLTSSRSEIALGIPKDLSPGEVRKFDQVALGLVRRLCDVGQVGVVISSARRAAHDWTEFGRALDLPTIGQTPALGRRGVEIQAWLDTHPEIEQFAILDDMDEMLATHRPHFVRTTYGDGLCFTTLRDLAEKFTLNIYDLLPQGDEPPSAAALAPRA